ncbi:FAD binding domain-containing protein [Nonomuraea typhae]|uniref:FAD binding domain-containing protein n=1 Tax=Nonomuraea typhae TaxID=2603600 RepID=UPI0012F80635|nr:FAD binding domain-containing protein [Nonomuraea typhae]
MHGISYARVADLREALAEGADPDSRFLAGGTTEVDMLRIGVAQEKRLVDINDLPLNQIEELPGGGLRLGALARMSDVAAAPVVRERFPMVAQALELGASAQLRNMASMGGNMMQRVRCAYFRETAMPCNKREPGSGCAAEGGFHRGHAVLGTSESCFATHPSDVAVPLVALDAVIHLSSANRTADGSANRTADGSANRTADGSANRTADGSANGSANRNANGSANRNANGIANGAAHGTRSMPLEDFFLLPGDTPEREHPIEHGELITAIEVPAAPVARRSLYLKVRDRESYEFALVSAAVAAAVENGMITDIRLALGGVATKPWRARTAERHLMGGPATREAFEAAAAAEMAQAVGRPQNAFKIELAKRTIVRVLERVCVRGSGS